MSLFNTNLIKYNTTWGILNENSHSYLKNKTKKERNETNDVSTVIWYSFCAQPAEEGLKAED